MTDREWALFAPFLPPPRRLGRPRTIDLREATLSFLVSPIIHTADIQDRDGAQLGSCLGDRLGASAMSFFCRFTNGFT